MLTIIDVKYRNQVVAELATILDVKDIHAYPKSQRNGSAPGL
jgi:hypothetical protein